jgi:hypothetical protein
VSAGVLRDPVLKSLADSYFIKTDYHNIIWVCSK